MLLGGKWKVEFENWNLVLKFAEGGETVYVIKDGNEEIYYGIVSWVYGEELGQNMVMWWMLDFKRILFYKFDDWGVELFYLVIGWLGFNIKYYLEYYFKVGVINLVLEFYVYDLVSAKLMLIDVGGG